MIKKEVSYDLIKNNFEHMKTNRILHTFLLFLLTHCVALLPVHSQDELPERPSPPRLVNDMANMLSSGEKNQLEMQLVEFHRETSNQIAIVTTRDLKGYEISDFAFRLGEKWGIGQQKFNNGILIVINPGEGDNSGDVFIATGYGLEGAIPDAIAKRIVENEIIPRFRSGQYYDGLQAAVNVLSKLSKGEISAPEYAKRNGEKRKKGSGLFVIILIVIFFTIFGGRRRLGHSSLGHGLPLFMLFTMLGSSSSRQSGSFGSFSSGSGSLGGGGGFGGFGGGGFGGGGAGGSW